MSIFIIVFKDYKTFSIEFIQLFCEKFRPNHNVSALPRLVKNKKIAQKMAFCKNIIYKHLFLKTDRNASFVKLCNKNRGILKKLIRIL